MNTATINIKAAVIIQRPLQLVLVAVPKEFFVESSGYFDRFLKAGLIT